MKQHHFKNMLYGIIIGGLLYLFSICLEVIVYSPIQGKAFSGLLICFWVLSGLLPLAFTVFKVPSFPELLCRTGISLVILVGFSILGGTLGVLRIMLHILNLGTNDVADNVAGIIIVFQYVVVFLSFFVSLVYAVLARLVRRQGDGSLNGG